MIRMKGNDMKQIKCSYCNKTKEENTFTIGACSKNNIDWCMIYGTGKMSCPDCYKQASEEGKQAVNKYIEKINKQFSRETIKQ